ncbi:MAG: methyltransferase domain-containing protein [Longimicrobiales bacterium]
MTGLARLEQGVELLDAACHDHAELAQSLGQLAAVNRWLGGRRALLRRLRQLAGRLTSMTVVDVGTGSADIPRELVRLARTQATQIQVIALDRHPQTVDIARNRCHDFPEIAVGVADACALPLPSRSVDFALLSLTLHHLDGTAQCAALRELARVSRRALLVGELERSRPAYAGARLLAATLWRSNRLTRHDGPVSVLRSFTPAELAALAQRAGLGGVRVTRHPFFRLVLSATVA